MVFSVEWRVQRSSLGFESWGRWLKFQLPPLRRSRSCRGKRVGETRRRHPRHNRQPNRCSGPRAEKQNPYRGGRRRCLSRRHEIGEPPQPPRRAQAEASRSPRRSRRPNGTPAGVTMTSGRSATATSERRAKISVDSRRAAQKRTEQEASLPVL
jgi:hypothetical protein